MHEPVAVATVTSLDDLNQLVMPARSAGENRTAHDQARGSALQLGPRINADVEARGLEWIVRTAGAMAADHETRTGLPALCPSGRSVDENVYLLQGELPRVRHLVVVLLVDSDTAPDSLSALSQSERAAAGRRAARLLHDADCETCERIAAALERPNGAEHSFPRRAARLMREGRLMELQDDEHDALLSVLLDNEDALLEFGDIVADEDEFDFEVRQELRCSVDTAREIKSDIAGFVSGELSARAERTLSTAPKSPERPRVDHAELVLAEVMAAKERVERIDADLDEQAEETAIMRARVRQAIEAQEQLRQELEQVILTAAHAIDEVRRAEARDQQEHEQLVERRDQMVRDAIERLIREHPAIEDSPDVLSVRQVHFVDDPAPAWVIERIRRLAAA